MHNQKTTMPSFRPFGEYDAEELRAIKFHTYNEADHALVLIGENPVLKRMPFLFADGFTFIVPNDAVETLKLLKLKFKVSTVLDSEPVGA